jgi:ribonuclease HII
VYAAAVRLDPLKIPRGLTDSKLLSAARREQLAQAILEHAQVGLGFATVEEIEELNIHHASLLAMQRAVSELRLAAGLLLVDGKFKVKNLPAWEQICLIKGELRAAPIAAASIVAKVTRDRKMAELALEFPQYGLEVHKGYATPNHRNAIAQYGITKIHRRTFIGVAEHCEPRAPS